MAKFEIEKTHVNAWERECNQADDRTVVRWLTLKWSAWRRSILESVARERGLL